VGVRYLMTPKTNLPSEANNSIETPNADFWNAYIVNMENKVFTEAFMQQFFTDGMRATHVRPDVASALENYFGGKSGGFTGSQFETLIKDSDPFVITAHDLIAITTLSVDVPARAMLWLLSDKGQREISEHLREIPDDIDIWDDRVADIFSDDGHVMKLWRALGRANWPIPRPGGGLGGITKRSKILVAKRPRLIPVLDRVVKGTLPESENIWVSIQDVLRVDDYRTKLMDVLQHADVPDSVSLLRRLDVVIWKNNEKNFRRKTKPTTTSP